MEVAYGNRKVAYGEYEDSIREYGGSHPENKTIAYEVDRYPSKI
jgi:hypothetical protein